MITGRYCEFILFFMVDNSDQKAVHSLMIYQKTPGFAGVFMIFYQFLPQYSEK